MGPTHLQDKRQRLVSNLESLQSTYKEAEADDEEKEPKR